ncbi:MAG: AAA-like domain-containing protein [Treponema sp.]|jgi:hypothetical protein|nr:AAA-like domain-containing protein [Treponema sp.]
MRHFNVTGLCVPEKHYMADISGKLAQIRAMVDQGHYFTINRARQYGKTTTLNMLEKTLAHEYIVAQISFEGLGDESFETPAAFCDTFMGRVQRAIQSGAAAEDPAYAADWVNPLVIDFKALGEHITSMCRGKKIVLMIDEVDKTSNNRVYIHFLGMLRDKYLARDRGKDFTFQSVILAGVYDIKNLKLKLINEGVYTPTAAEGVVRNSPWNIAANFKVDMSFNPAEIAAMLIEYENDHHSGMDIPAISSLIYDYTDGYPYLVSDICKLIDEEFGKDWTAEGIQKAIRYIVNEEQNTLFDDIIKNLESYKDLSGFIYAMLFLSTEKPYSIRDPAVEWALMFGFVKQQGGKIRIGNKIFELVIADYFMSKDAHHDDQKRITGVLAEDVIAGGRFNMELALRKFAEHYRQLYNKKDAPFLERQGMLLFLSYLKPLINGRGFYHIESQLADSRRMDLVVNFGRDEFIVELKIWHGGVSHKAAQGQLAGYLKSRGAGSGYLVSFDFRQEGNQSPCEEWVDCQGLRIFSVIL